MPIRSSLRGCVCARSTSKPPPSNGRTRSSPPSASFTTRPPAPPPRSPGCAFPRSTPPRAIAANTDDAFQIANGIAIDALTEEDFVWLAKSLAKAGRMDLANAAADAPPHRVHAGPLHRRHVRSRLAIHAVAARCALVRRRADHRAATRTQRSLRPRLRSARPHRRAFSERVGGIERLSRRAPSRALQLAPLLRSPRRDRSRQAHRSGAHPHARPRRVARQSADAFPGRTAAGREAISVEQRSRPRRRSCARSTTSPTR